MMQDSRENDFKQEMKRLFKSTGRLKYFEMHCNHVHLQKRALALHIKNRSGYFI